MKLCEQNCFWEINRFGLTCKPDEFIWVSPLPIWMCTEVHAVLQHHQKNTFISTISVVSNTFYTLYFLSFWSFFISKFSISHDLKMIKNRINKEPRECLSPSTIFYIKAVMSGGDQAFSLLLLWLVAAFTSSLLCGLVIVLFIWSIGGVVRSITDAPWLLNQKIVSKTLWAGLKIVSVFKKLVSGACNGRPTPVDDVGPQSTLDVKKFGFRLKKQQQYFLLKWGL